MSLYVNLLKNNLIELDKVLIDKYSLFDLDETDCILLIKIYNAINKSENIDANTISKKMSITKALVASRIVSLCERGYLEISIDDNGIEQYSLEGLCEKIQDVMDLEGESEKANAKQNSVKEIVKYVTKSFNKVLSSIDLQTINHLVINDGYSTDEIKDAVDKCSMQRKFALKYVDAYLQSSKIVEKSHTDNKIEEKFDNVFKKIK